MNVICFKVKFFDPFKYLSFGMSVRDLGAIPVKVYAQII